MTFRNVPQIIYDAYLVSGNDLQLTSTGDLLLANGGTLANQRIPRRLLTTSPDYIWHSDYGAGLPTFVGQPLTVDTLESLKSLITAQIFLESVVAQNPPPEIFLQTIQNGLFGQINYSLSPSLQPIVLTFGVE